MFKPLTSPAAWSTMIRNILMATNWIFSEPILSFTFWLLLTPPSEIPYQLCLLLTISTPQGLDPSLTSPSPHNVYFLKIFWFVCWSSPTQPRPISVSFLIRTSGIEHQSQACSLHPHHQIVFHQGARLVPGLPPSSNFLQLPLLELQPRVVLVLPQLSLTHSLRRWKLLSGHHELVRLSKTSQFTKNQLHLTS